MSYFRQEPSGAEFLLSEIQAIVREIDSGRYKLVYRDQEYVSGAPYIHYGGDAVDISELRRAIRRATLDKDNKSE